MFADNQPSTLFEMGDYEQYWFNEASQSHDSSSFYGLETPTPEYLRVDKKKQGINSISELSHYRQSVPNLCSSGDNGSLDQLSICELNSQDNEEPSYEHNFVQKSSQVAENAFNISIFDRSQEDDHKFATNSSSSNSDSGKASTSLKECVHDESKVKFCINRRDVVIKSILRSMRKYYADLIQDNTGFKRRTRNTKLKHRMLLQSSAEILENTREGAASKSLAFCLASVAFPCDMKKLLASLSKSRKVRKEVVAEGLLIIDVIESTLNRFSKKVLASFMSKPELCVLLLNYLGKVRNEEYQEHYDMLSDMAKNSVAKQSKNESWMEQLSF
eukprot:CAMPEP_0168331576 /NCGR_PEP_ID=MMETSP0213-20121227/8416_1 /TAXON_ID=151035 /ORGANISM="Euplotes harpa, Strain FSP1.4" /LENGTH=329 /DNA_ID=CAMNT_0008335379 /DNA_START=20 /DNA_END=1009 /DNA_ORIENTATION=+